MNRTEDAAPEKAGTRSIVIEKEIPDTTPEEVWETLATGEGLRRWFPLDARVRSGEGGTIWLSWGPGSEAEAPLHAWDPPRHFGWTEMYGTDEAGRPLRLAVDFHIEGREGSTVVRLVHSGFGASDDWDAMYDAMTDGWTYFLFNLVYYFLKHRGKGRRLVWKRVATDLARDAAWERLAGAAMVAGGGSVVAGSVAEVVLDRARPAEVVSARPGHHFAAVLPDLDHSILFVELEGRHIGFWLSTYDASEAYARALQEALEARISVALGGG